jgi:putative transposase
VIFIPKGRKKELYGEIREYLKQVFHELARQRGSEIVEGYMAGDHVHMCIAIPPKYAVSTVGFELDKIRDYIRRQEHEEHEEDQGRF